MSGRRAIVIRVQGDRVYVMTENRHFRSVTLSAGTPRPAPGEVIVLPGRSRLSAAAAFAAGIAAVLLIGFYVLGGFFSPTAVAYLEMEINPQLVLSLDSGARVIGAVAHNEEAEALLDVLPRRPGSASEACSFLVRAAVDLGYLQPGAEHVILATAYPAADEGEVNLDLGEIKEAVSEALVQRGIAFALGVNSVGEQVAVQARANGLSVGREALRLHLEEMEIELPAEALRDLPLGQLFRRAGVAPRDLAPPGGAQREETHQQGSGQPSSGDEEDSSPGSPEPGERGSENAPESETPGHSPRPSPGRRPR
ncbi:MAG: hypothetical protein R6U70_11460 [Bacillota bacterium]